MNRIKLRPRAEFGDLVEESIIRCCGIERQNHEDIAYSTFFVSHYTYHRIYNRFKWQPVVERGPRDWRILFSTPWGPVYIEPTSEISDESDDAAQLEVVWGSEATYEHCIEQAETWMQRAEALRGK